MIVVNYYIFKIGNVNIVWIKINSIELMIISVVFLFIWLYILLKSGVRNKVFNGNRLGIVFVNFGFILYFCIIKFVVYFKKGNMVE